MNITLIRATKRKNSSTYNGAKHLVSQLKNVEKVFEFTLPDDCPHVCCGCYACLNGKMWDIDNKYWKDNFYE